jgi:2-polyprenyl-6-hydroxyphenyl methylase/3-demethylubiquinone-9 3-methyltransferase
VEANERRARAVNNAIYSELGARWYEAADDPVALLRAESRHRNPWVARQIAEALGPGPARALDVGCGAGFLSNFLAAAGHDVTGLDASAESLAVAARHDRTGRVAYELGDALALPYPDASFDVVCAMDFLEHVEEPARAVAEVGRVLRPSGLFFFHTFNRTLLSYLIVIKGVEWFVKNTPPDLHVLRLFLRPAEVEAMCRASGMRPVQLLGSRPRFGRALWRLARTGVVPDDFAFTFSRSTRLAYTGVARREPGATAAFGGAAAAAFEGGAAWGAPPPEVARARAELRAPRGARATKERRRRAGATRGTRGYGPDHAPATRRKGPAAAACARAPACALTRRDDRGAGDDEWSEAPATIASQSAPKS